MAASWIVERAAPAAETLDADKTAMTTLAVADTIDIGAAILAILFVRRLAAMQQAMTTRPVTV